MTMAERKRPKQPAAQSREREQSSSTQPRDRVHGEGNYAASRQYNEATKRFVDSGQVDDAAAEAAPRDESEARELERAEQAGRARAKEEDPEVSQPARPRGRRG
jgi:hypothetical protein